MFRPVTSRANFPQIEENVLKLWKKNKTFEQSIKKRQGGPRFNLYEGPPTANGSPGIHHILSRAFKDVIPRYKAMKGYYAPRIAGWDTHGLPVELEVEKELGFSSKTQIEEYGIDKFNAKCRESVFKYLKDWDALTDRIGFWVDLKSAYITMDNKYIETGWWAIKQMWDRGLIYQGYRVTPHCPRCGTSLSSHEVALGYQDNVEDPSVYIQFKVALPAMAGSDVRQRLTKVFSSKETYFLAWTTTPWTLPANSALAVSPEAEYSIVEVENAYLIMATARLMSVGLEQNKVVDKVSGSDLVGLYYVPLYNMPVAKTKEDKPGYRVIQGDFVSMEDGTGIVHVAPAYGEIDFDIGEKENLPLIHVVDLRGQMKAAAYGFTPRFRKEAQPGTATPVTPTTGTEVSTIPGQGRFVKDADKLIMDDLQSRGLLFRREAIRHTYPFCWRCGTPLLYYAKETWYIKTTAVKDALISGNNSINWYPEHIKYGRFGDWLEHNVDWAFSRERYWGTPLPVWRCETCGTYECVGGVNDLKKRAGFTGLKEPMDLHRPYVDEATFACPKCGGKMKRVPEVIDCWFDSGAMPIAQNHYPFENSTMFEDGRFPADFICEAVDQTRGWFYSLHAISTLLFNRICFKNVICLGLILDANGEKMSKTHGNIVEPWTVINKYGADALRWYLYTAAPPGNVRRFSEDMVADVNRRFLLTLWNVYSFFVTYANIDRFTPSAKTPAAQAELDRWIISELNQLIADVTTAVDSYDPTEAARKIETFVEDLSNWYVRRSRRRFWKSESDADKLSAYSTLYECLVTLAKLLAPFTPFLADELYQNLVGTVSSKAPNSVHLTDFPVADVSKIDKELSAATQLAMKVASLGRAARSQAGVKVRQPLAKVVIKVKSNREKEGLRHLMPQILDELNVKDMELVGETEEINKPGFAMSADETCAVALPTEISAELKAEGMAREIVHRLQTMRRSAGFDIADHIVTYYSGDDYIKQVMTDFADYIKQETLSRELVERIPAQDVFTETHKLSGCQLSLGVKKTD